MNEIQTKQTESSIMDGRTDAWMTCNFTSFLTVFRSYQDDGWMTCNFTSFSTVFQSYQDDAWVIMNDCEQWNPIQDCKIPTFSCSDPPPPPLTQQYFFLTLPLKINPRLLINDWSHRSCSFLNILLFKILPQSC